MISKEEIKAKTQATIKRKKEEAEQKKALGIVICRGCGEEFQKKELTHTDLCSWHCALNSSQGYFPNNYTSSKVRAQDCWTNVHRETINYEDEEQTLMTVAETLFKEGNDIPETSICACGYLKRGCVNWRHFKEITKLEQALLIFEQDEQINLVEKLIIEEKKFILQDFIEHDDIATNEFMLKLESHRDNLEHLKAIKERLKKQSEKRNYIEF